LVEETEVPEIQAGVVFEDSSINCNWAVAQAEGVTVMVGTPIGVLAWVKGALAVSKWVTLAIVDDETAKAVTLQYTATVKE
jgi:hypothetical protein